MQGRGNLFNNVLAEFDDLSYEELKDKTIQQMELCFQLLGKMNKDLEIRLMTLPARLGAFHDGKYNAKEKKLIKDVYSRYMTGSAESIYSALSYPMDEIDFALLNGFAGDQLKELYPLSMPYFRAILGFAYADNVLEDELCEFLERIFSPALMMSFFNSDYESVPIAGNLISGTEADIAEWLKEDDKFVPEQQIYQNFRNLDRREISNALNSLEKQGIITRTNILGTITVGLSGASYRISKNEKTNPSSKDFKQTSSVNLKHFPAVKAIEGTGYEGRADRIEHISVGDQLILKADWNSKYYTPVAIEVFNKAEETLGYLENSGDNPTLEEIATIVESGEYSAIVDSVTPKSKRSKNAKYALMDVRIEKISGKSELKPKTVKKTSSKTVTDNKKKVSINTGSEPKESEELIQPVDVANAMTVYLPEYMSFTTENVGAVGQRVLTAYTSDLDITKTKSLSTPFEAKRNITILASDFEPLDFSDRNTSESAFDAYVQLIGSMFKAKTIFNARSDETVFARYFYCGPNRAVIIIAVPKGIFTCQYFINDTRKRSDQKKLVEAFISKIESFDSKKKSVNKKGVSNSSGKQLSKTSTVTLKEEKKKKTVAVVKANNESDQSIKPVRQKKETHKLTAAEKKRVSAFEKACTAAKSNDIEEVEEAIDDLQHFTDFEDCEEIIDQAKRNLEKLTNDRECRYQALCAEIKTADSIEAFNKLSSEFYELRDYKDSEELQDECDRKIKELTLEKKNLSKYQSILARINEASSKKEFDSIIKDLNSLKGYKDCDSLIETVIKKRNDNELKPFHEAVNTALEKLNDEEKKRDEQINSLKDQISTNRENIEKYESERSSLGFFSFKRKKELRENINYLQSKNKNLEDEIDKIKKNHNSQIQLLKKKLEKEEIDLRKKQEELESSSAPYTSNGSSVAKEGKTASTHFGNESNLNDASKKMIQIVESFRKKTEEAESNFVEGYNNIQQMASRTINIYDSDVSDQVGRITEQTRKLCEGYNSLMQTYVRSIDIECKRLVDKNPSSEAVKQVVDLIKHLNEESEIEANFTASFEQTQLGDVGTVKYTTTIESQRIQKWWENYYKSGFDTSNI